MNTITLSSQSPSGYTFLSNDFIDNYMPSANGEFVKIYVYLIRCLNTNRVSLSVNYLADTFNHTENDVIRALKYWNNTGLLELGFDTNGKDIVSIKITDSAVSHAALDSTIAATSATVDTTDISDDNTDDIPVNIPVIETPSISEQFKKPTYTSAQLKAFAQESELKQLLYISQKYLGKTLTSTETNTIIYFYATLKFPSDLIEYLIELCVSKEHKSMRYIEKVALNWAEAGVKSVSEAKEISNTYNNNTFSIMKAFGLSSRNPGKKEMDYINKWNDCYCFSSEMIIEACNRTLQATHQPSFEYADSILTKWRAANVKRLSELEQLDKEYAMNKAAKASQKATTRTAKPAANNKFNNFEQRTYDYDELEKQLLSNNV